MGLYQSELSKQIHLRKIQQREWESLKKKISLNMQEKEKESNEREFRREQEEREENRTELEETNTSKKLAANMVQSALESRDDTLKKVADLLQNQNGKF